MIDHGIAMTRTKTRRNALHRRDARCHWCGVETVLPPKVIPVHFRPPANMATIDHLRNRSHDDRHEPNPRWEERTVLACWKCNNDRNRGEMLAAGLSEQQKTSPASREKLVAIIREQSRVIARLKRALTDHGLASVANRIKVNPAMNGTINDFESLPEWKKRFLREYFGGNIVTRDTPTPTPDLAERIAEKLESVGLLDVTNPGDFVSQSAAAVRPLLEPLERDAALLAKLRAMAAAYPAQGDECAEALGHDVFELLLPEPPPGNSRPSGTPE